ncbi:MAG TPA: hypothetical protein VG738_23085 [Chitinophagaceae bacterium]|nr:hypothetical protein [Chitinophagaceae bacterium]
MRKIIFIIGGVAFLGLMVYYFSSFFIDTLKVNKALQLHVPSTYVLTHDDSNLISEEYLKNIKVIEICQSRYRNPISLLKFNTKYNLVIYKINLSVELPLSAIVSLKMQSEDISSGYSYMQIYSGNLNLFFKDVLSKGDSIMPANKIILTLSGDSFRQTLAFAVLGGVGFTCFMLRK